MEQLDTTLFLTLNHLHTPWLDGFMWLYTGRFIWVPFYIAILAMMIKAWGWRRAIVAALCIGACVALADQLCATLLRPVFCRPRPSNLAESPIAQLVVTVNDYRGGRYGFPSCHGANSFALAVASWIFVRRWSYGVIIMVWALVNCYTRVYLGVHYPGDLLAGALVGTITALAISLPAVKRLGLSPAPRLTPAIPGAVYLATLAAISLAAIP